MEMVVNFDGWIGKVLNFETGKYSKLCPGSKMIEVEVTDYTELLENKPDFYKNDIKKYCPIGKIILCNENQFKPYPEYKGFSCGKWIK